MPISTPSLDKPFSALALLMAVRDAQLVRKADRQLLDALILRCKVKDKYKSWPTYATLAQDTGLHPKTLRTSAARLEAAQLIRRKGTTTSNVFFVNAELIISKGIEARDARKARAAARAAAARDTEEPLFDPVAEHDIDGDEDEDGDDNSSAFISGGAL